MCGRIGLTSLLVKKKDEHARDHDDAMRRCMSQLLDVAIPDGVPPTVCRRCGFVQYIRSTPRVLGKLG